MPDPSKPTPEQSPPQPMTDPAVPPMRDPPGSPYRDPSRRRRTIRQTSRCAIPIRRPTKSAGTGHRRRRVAPGR